MTSIRRLWRLALVVAASAFAAPELAAQGRRPDNAPIPEIRRIELEGVKAVDAADLTLSIFTERTRCKSAILSLVCRFSRWRALEERHYLNRQELARDLLRIRVYYYKHGFREATVDTVVSVLNEKAVAVRFNIVEGLPTLVANVSVTADSTLMPSKRLNALTRLEAGKPLDLFVFDSTRVNFQNALWDLGYADALVDTSSVVDAVARTARVQFRLVPNHITRVGQIVIQGTEKVAASTVLNSLSFRPGDLYRRGNVLESQRNLYESNLFKLAAIEVPPSFDSIKTVNVLLREAPLREARLSGGFNTVDFAQTEARFSHYNLLGGARRLDISATAGNLLARSLNGRSIFRRQRTDSSVTEDIGRFLSPTWQTSISLTQPAFLRRPRNSLGIGAFAQRRAVPAVVIDRGYGGNLTYTRSLGFRAPASLSYRFEVTRVEAGGPYFCVNFGVCDTTTIGTLRSHQRLSPALATVQVDRTDVPLAPTRGYSARADLEHASSLTVSDYRYNRGYAEGALFTRLGAKNAVFATRLRVGFVRPLGGSRSTGQQPVLHPRKRFYAGGSQSVRGFGENQLGPRILTLPHQFLVNARTSPGGPRCDPSSDAIRLCDPETAADSVLGADGGIRLVGPDKFTPRPLGGTSLIEASAEYRFPLPFLQNLSGAVFVDGAAVGERVLDPFGQGLSTLANLVRGTGAITPGFGIRYRSPVGPIRVDAGLNPSRAEPLAVVTELIRNGKREIVALDKPYVFSPGGTSKGISQLLSRFTLHLSIGEAY